MFREELLVVAQTAERVGAYVDEKSASASIFERDTTRRFALESSRLDEEEESLRLESEHAQSDLEVVQREQARKGIL